MTFQNHDYNYLTALLSASAPSSYEFAATKIFREYLSLCSEGMTKDNMGNTFAVANAKGDVRIMISAHIDEIGFQITDICNDGLLRIRTIGGVCNDHLQGHRVTVLTGHKNIHGTLVGNNVGRHDSYDFCPFLIDINAFSKEEAESNIHIGDFATFAPFYLIENGIIGSKSIDNRIGVYSISQVFYHLGNKLKNVQLIATATTQEEIGLRGMALAAQKNNPDICINIDVTDALQIGKNERLPKIGKGVVVYTNADTNPMLRKLIIEIAGEKNIPIQMALGRSITGGTDSSRIQIFSHQTAVAELSIPCKYIHTNHEICALQDVSSCIDLCTALIEEIDKMSSFYSSNPFVY